MSISLDSLMGLPPSILSITANSLALSCIILAILKIYFPLSFPLIFDQLLKALLAEFTAKSTSFLLAPATLAIISSVAGFIVSKYFFEFGFTNSPFINKSYFSFNII